MATKDNLQQKIDTARKSGYSDEQIQTFLTSQGITDTIRPAVTEPSYLEGLKTDITTRADRTADILNRPDSSMLEKGVQVFGQGAGLAANATEKTVEQIPGVKQAFGVIGSGINWLSTSEYSPAKMLGEKIGESEALQEIVGLYDTDQNFQDSVDAVANVARLGGDVQMASQAVGLAKKAVTGLASGAKTAIATTKTSLDAFGKNITQKAGDLTKGIRDVVKPLVQEAKTLPGKASVNLAQVRATEATIKKLPTVGQTAVRSGVGLDDVKKVYDITKKSPASVKPLVKAVQDFASGKSKVNPLEVVGKPMVAGLKKAQINANTIGQKLGQVADDLPNFSPADLKQSVFTSLKKVRGLEGLEITPKGTLNFKNTTLATAATKADRVAIQRIFNDAIKTGSSKSKHLLRQELFEVLGGKKRGGIQITGTQENAYEAVRKGIADSLEKVSPQYKALNMEYAKAISPIQKLKKLLGTAGVDDDILNMKAGLLARRVTSFSKSNPEIRQILRDLDKIIGTKGTTALGIENLQDLYNILDNYYDIKGQTGFQGQVTAGVSKALNKSGLSRGVDLIEGEVAKIFGETDIVKQKALEAVLKDVLGLK